MKFGFVGPSYSLDNVNADAQTCINWYPEKVESGDGNSPMILEPTPGLQPFANLGVSLAIAKSHTGNFTQGQTNATFQLVVTNNGAVPTSGSVVVSDTLPPGLTFVSMTGTGWTYIGNQQVMRNDSLAPSASYPPITVTANVASDARSPQVNQASAGGGGISVPVTSSDSVIINSTGALAPFPIPDSATEFCYNGTLPLQLSLMVPAGGWLAGDTIVTAGLVGTFGVPMTSVTDSLGNTFGFIINEFISGGAFVIASLVLPSNVAGGTSYVVTYNGAASGLTGEVSLQAWRDLGAPQLSEVVTVTPGPPHTAAAPSITNVSNRAFIAVSAYDLKTISANWVIVTPFAGTFYPAAQAYWDGGSSSIAPPSTYTATITAADVRGAGIVPFAILP